MSVNTSEITVNYHEKFIQKSTVTLGMRMVFSCESEMNLSIQQHIPVWHVT